MYYADIYQTPICIPQASIVNRTRRIHKRHNRRHCGWAAYFYVHNDVQWRKKRSMNRAQKGSYRSRAWVGTFRVTSGACFVSCVIYQWNLITRFNAHAFKFIVCTGQALFRAVPPTAIRGALRITVCIFKIYQKRTQNCHHTFLCRRTWRVWSMVSYGSSRWIKDLFTHQENPTWLPDVV